MLLGLGGLGPGLEHVLLGAGLGDLAFETHQAFFERLHLARLALQLGVEGVGGVLVGLAAGEGFAGQVFLALLQGQLGPLVPGFGLGSGLLGLVLDAFLAGDGGGHGLAKLHQLGLHVRHGLVEDFAGIFGATQHRVGVGPHQTAKASKETHERGAGAGMQVSQHRGWFTRAESPCLVIPKLGHSPNLVIPGMGASRSAALAWVHGEGPP